MSIKIGIVGGYGHESVRHFPGASLAWALDGFDDAAFKKALKYGSRQTYASLEGMLEEFAPDIVYVGSVFTANGRLSALALERGYDVITEKPLAADWPTLCRLRDLTRSGDRRVIAEFTMRWNASFRRVREIVRSGQIGDTLMVHAQKTYKFGTARPAFYRDRALFGGLIPWVAIHAIDLVAWCTELSYRRVSAGYAPGCFDGFPSVETGASMLFEMDGGIPCTIHADFRRPAGARTHDDDRIRITGTEGAVEVSENEVVLISSEGESRWQRGSDDFSAVSCAEAIVAAALGETNEISTFQCINATGAALAARDAADSGETHAVSRVI